MHTYTLNLCTVYAKLLGCACRWPPQSLLQLVRLPSNLLPPNQICFRRRHSRPPSTERGIEPRPCTCQHRPLISGQTTYQHLPAPTLRKRGQHRVVQHLPFSPSGAAIRPGFTERVRLGLRAIYSILRGRYQQQSIYMQGRTFHARAHANPPQTGSAACCWAQSINQMITCAHYKYHEFVAQSLQYF